MGRLTECDSQGNWCVKGLPWKDTYVGRTITDNTSEKTYSALCKLKDYEDTGLEPCEIPVLLDRLKRASEQWDIWCDAYQKDVPVWIPVAERIPVENEYRVVCAAHSGKPFLRRFEVAYITDTVGYQFGYYDGYKWIDKCYEVIQNVVAWKNHEPFIQN